MQVQRQTRLRLGVSMSHLSGAKARSVDFVRNAFCILLKIKTTAQTPSLTQGHEDSLVCSLKALDVLPSCLSFGSCVWSRAGIASTVFSHLVTVWSESPPSPGLCPACRILTMAMGTVHFTGPSLGRHHPVRVQLLLPETVSLTEPPWKCPWNCVEYLDLFGG